MASITLEHITKSFGPSAVIRDLTLTIEEGEFFTFVGPSGCGKSTILNIIAGLEEVTGGRILFDGEPVTALSPKERDVAMVFQSYALYPHMTVYENVAFPLRMQRLPKTAIDGEVRRTASLLGLDGLLDRKPKELSGGQRQRVALGRAIVRKPRVFLMDEPLSNLDARLRLETRAELKRLHQELGITTVYVTHDQAEAMSLSGRMAVLHQGEVQQVGPPREVYDGPVNRFVAGFIGSPPVNILPCTVVSREPLELECLGQRFLPRTGRRPSGSRVSAGLRPEDVLVSAENGGLAAEVSVVEPSGPFDWIVAERGGVRLTGRAPAGHDLRPGSSVRLHLPLEKAFIFDEPEGGRI